MRTKRTPDLDEKRAVFCVELLPLPQQMMAAIDAQNLRAMFVLRSLRDVHAARSRATEDCVVSVYTRVGYVSRLVARCASSQAVRAQQGSADATRAQRASRANVAFGRRSKRRVHARNDACALVGARNDASVFERRGALERCERVRNDAARSKRRVRASSSKRRLRAARSKRRLRASSSKRRVRARRARNDACALETIRARGARAQRTSD
jgi:hypothetical protein